MGGLELTIEAILDLAARDVLALQARERRVVDHEDHRERGLVDRHERHRLGVVGRGERVAREDVLEASDGDDEDYGE